MIKRRLIPVLFIKNGLIVRSEGFSLHQIIGNVINEAKRYNEWDVDELIYCDISREQKYDSRRDDHKIKSIDTIDKIISEISKVCFMPLTFGGGIRTITDVDLRIRNGADKITINTGALLNKGLIKKSALKYGSQSIVISIDFLTINDVPIVFSHFGQINTNISVFEWVKECESLGAGEFFLNSIERDGKACGYDTKLINNVLKSTRLPVIACGGAGSLYDFVDIAQETNVSGIAAGNFFHFTERSYPRAKELLKKENINVR